MVELKGVLWRKLQDMKKVRVKEHKALRMDIARETEDMVNRLSKSIEKDIIKSEKYTDAKLNMAIHNLQVLNLVCKKIVKQNQEIINLLKKKRKVTVSI